MVHEGVLRKKFVVLFKLFSFYCWYDVYVQIHFLATKDEQFNRVFVFSRNSQPLMIGNYNVTDN